VVRVPQCQERADDRGGQNQHYPRFVDGNDSNDERRGHGDRDTGGNESGFPSQPDLLPRSIGPPVGRFLRVALWCQRLRESPWAATACRGLLAAEDLDDVVEYCFARASPPIEEPADCHCASLGPPRP
jgi:hypothetical protein